MWCNIRLNIIGIGMQLQHLTLKRVNDLLWLYDLICCTQMIKSLFLRLIQVKNKKRKQNNVENNYFVTILKLVKRWWLAFELNKKKNAQLSNEMNVKKKQKEIWIMIHRRTKRIHFFFVFKCRMKYFYFFETN